MIVAVTGGRGFIGKHLVDEHLGRGDTVRVLTREGANAVQPGIEYFHGDLAAPSDDVLAAFVAGADVVYHCAGEVQDPSRMHAVHVGGTDALLRAAAGRIGRWVQLSSVGVYGVHSSGVVTEETTPSPVGVYEVTKAEADARVIAAGERGEIEFAILRPSIVFGGTMRNRSLFQLISLISAGRFFFIGRPGASANYVHVRCVVEALLRCATRPAARNRVYNLSDWRSMEAWVGAISAGLGRPAPRVRVPEWVVRRAVAWLGWLPRLPLTGARVDALVNRSRYSVDRIRAELDYEHPVSMEEGIGELVLAWTGAR